MERLLLEWRTEQGAPLVESGVFQEMQELLGSVEEDMGKGRGPGEKKRTWVKKEKVG